MNLANKITMFRIFLVPIFVLFLTSIPQSLINAHSHSYLTHQNSVLIATFIFIIASITDKLDGYIARKYNQVTNLGKLLDPIADKLMVSCAFIFLVGTNQVAAWIVLLIISREFAVTGLRIMAAKGNKVLAADKLGKIKMVTQVIAIILALLNNYSLALSTYLPFTQGAMFIAMIITVYSGINYIMKNRQMFRDYKTV
jgi:CDP-diacylglycerol--glycerol-3-phosphate 3-phosphatidyltransferase